MGPPILNVAATLAPFTCKGFGDLAKQLPRAPSEHRDARLRLWMAFRNESARSIDAQHSPSHCFSVDPILRAFTRTPLYAQKLPLPSAPMTLKTIMDLGGPLHHPGLTRHFVSAFHGLDRARGRKHIAAGLLRGRSPARTRQFSTESFLATPSFCQSFSCSQNECGIPVADLEQS